MQLLWLLSSVALGVVGSRPACSYKETLPLTSLAEVREAVPIGTPVQNAKDTMSLAGFVCRPQRSWYFHGNSKGIGFGSTKYVECINIGRTALAFKREIQVKLVIVDDKVADIHFSASYNWPYGSKPASPAFTPPIGPSGAFLPPWQPAQRWK